MALICVIISIFVLFGVPTIAQSSIDSEPVVLEAREGDTVVLPCDQTVPTPSPDLPIALFLLQWERQDIDQPFFVLFDSAQPYISEQYNGRIALEANGASLEMSGVTLSDAGIYECKIIELSNLESIGNGTFVNLVVLGPPRFISTPPESVVFQENQEASLKCQVEAVPTPTVKWYRHGELIEPSSGITVMGDSITIKRVSRDDAGTYICEAENSEGRVMDTTRFVVEGAPHIFVPPQDTVVTLGQSASLDCEALSAPDNLTQQWFFEGLLVQEVSHLEARVEVSARGALTIRGTGVEDQGVYSCTPTNGLGTPPTASAFLDVQYAAQVVTMPTEVYSTRGEDAELPCNLTANPELLYVIWRKDETEIRITETNRYSTTLEGSLIISEASMSDQGYYTCTPYNDLGTAGQSDPTFLNVIDPPSFSSEPEPSYEKSLGSSVSMPCSATGNPPPILTWKKVNGELSSRAVVSGTSLSISDVKKEDHGMYECLAVNQVATIIVTTELVVSPTSPHTPTGIAVVTSSTSAYISWEAGFDGGDAQTFAIRYRPYEGGNGLWTTIHSIPETFFSMLLYGLGPSTLYEFTVIATNDLGSSQPSSPVTATTKDADPYVHPTDSTGATLVPLPEDVKPSPPQNVTLTTREDGLYLSWLPPPSYAEYVDHYTIEYRIAGPWLILEDRVSVDVTEVLLQNLQPNTTYQFRVFAFTLATFSDPSTPVEGDTTDLLIYMTAIPRRSSTTPGIIAGVISGLCFLLIALLLFTLAIIVAHRRKEKKKQLIIKALGINGAHLEAQSISNPNNTTAPLTPISSFQKSLSKLKVKLSPKPDRASPSHTDPTHARNGTTDSQNNSRTQPHRRSLRDRNLTWSLDNRSGSYRVESEIEEGEISTVSRRLDYGLFNSAPSQTNNNEQEVINDFADITIIDDNIEQGGQPSSENSYPSSTGAREDQPLTPPSRSGRDKRRDERGDYVYYHGGMLLTGGVSSEDEYRNAREGGANSSRGASPTRQPGEWGSQTMVTFGQHSPQRYTNPPENRNTQITRTPDSRNTSVWTEDRSGFGDSNYDHQMHRHSTRKDVKAGRPLISNYPSIDQPMQGLTPNGLDSVSTIPGSEGGRSVTPTPMEFQEYPTGASYEYSSQQLPSPEVPHPRKASPYKDMMRRVNAEVYSDPSIVSVSPLGSRDFTADYADPYDSDMKSSRFGSYVHSDVFSPPADERTFGYSDDGYHASQDVSDYQHTDTTLRADESDARLQDTVVQRSKSPRSMSPRAKSPRAKSPRWRSPLTVTHLDNSLPELDTSHPANLSRASEISPIPSHPESLPSPRRTLSPSLMNNSQESFSSIEGIRDQSHVGPLPSFGPRRTLSPVSRDSLSSGYGSRNTSTNTSSIRGRRSFPSMEEVQEEREDSPSPISDTKKEDSTDENYEFDKGLDSEFTEALKRYFEPENSVIIIEEGDTTGKSEDAEKRCQELKKEYEEYKKQTLIEEETTPDIARDMYRPFKQTSVV